METDTQLQYAGFWRRIVAFLIDSLVLGAPWTALEFLFVYVAMEHGEVWKLSDGEFYLATGVWWGALLASSWLYCALMESSERGATVGKIVVGARVSGLCGERVSFGVASARYWIRFATLLLLSAIAAAIAALLLLVLRNSDLLNALLEFDVNLARSVAALMFLIAQVWASVFVVLLIAYAVTIVFSKRKQAIHDILSKCLVVKTVK